MSVEMYPVNYLMLSGKKDELQSLLFDWVSQLKIQTVCSEFAARKLRVEKSRVASARHSKSDAIDGW